MPPRKAPTARQRRLGSELRKIREHAGISLTDAAAQLSTDRTTMSSIESGRFGVSSERVRTWASHYACPDANYVDALAAIAAERGRGWWDDYRDDLSAGALDLSELEHHAVAIRAVQIMHMPGLLQTEDYARAVFEEAVPALRPVDLRRRLSHRMRRRDVLDRADAPAFTFLIHEAALRMRFGDRKITSNQLDYLLKQSERDNVTVRVIPFEVGGFPNAGSSTLYAHGPVPQLDTVQTDTPTGPAFLDAETRLANYRAVLDRTEERAYDPERSRDFIREMAQQV
ncbi:Scr1 family TA system antitoxin-like transcriptional regulator [Streptomyces sp. NBC_00091]|uniref:Scr1 family TA system antitoxin-like transcriptional regulator n=1 Tax=Streptomyces sp. NBC_00091 TaxID=2975648 RepID=UPI00224F00D1|nr:Scr1 family TA system antitoxin-like transcriptional regulator [Streptomyces sp. NBC_00091]MCX5376720.1 Scr1 family TA system antitoxin-like transcriptional regulator [Streptomyces sp. NBC_00091]